MSQTGELEDRFKKKIVGLKMAVYVEKQEFKKFCSEILKRSSQFEAASYKNHCNL
jgi:hypothetical protein